MKNNSNERAANAHAPHRTVDAAAAGAHEAVDWTADAANNATDSLSDTSQEMKATQERWLATARDYVQEHPATALGIALAGGYLFSRIFSAR